MGAASSLSANARGTKAHLNVSILGAPASLPARSLVWKLAGRDAGAPRGSARCSRVRLLWLLSLGGAAWLDTVPVSAAAASPPDYAAVDAIFNQHCLDCHAAQDPEHGLVLENFESLMQGGETGPPIVPGKSLES